MTYTGIQTMGHVCTIGVRRMLEWGANPEIHNDEGDTPHLKVCTDFRGLLKKKRRERHIIRVVCT